MGETDPVFEVGKTQATIINKQEAPLEETEMKVLLELSGSGDIYKDRAPLDLVTVLDVSGSMNAEDRIGNLKIAMQFLIHKLSPIDRLSVVVFSSDSTRLFPLRHITNESQLEIIETINALRSHGATNMAAGLKTGIQVLEDRRLYYGRVGAIMLMSDGDQSLRFGDARNVQVDNFAVHTFGLGSDARSEVLQVIAERSKGGTFSDVRNQNDLTKAFSQCLGGLLTVVVQDLNLTLTQVDDESKIKNVSAGNYPTISNTNNDSVTISFGELYNNEVRMVMVDLLLPKVDSKRSPDFLHVTYTYSADKRKRPFEAPRLTATVTKTATGKEVPKMILEKNRLKTLNSVKEARALADNRELERAKDKVDEAKNSLVGVKDVDDPKQVIKTLMYDLEQLSGFVKSQKEYEEKGRPYAMSFETSHERQRYAARGDVDAVRAFATPRMDAYLEQAKEFEKDPTKPPPSVEDDVKQEIKQEILDNPRIPYYIKLAFQVGESIGHASNTSTRRT
ncbi:hypothetical protein TIFTF001_022699 [Ficus carica]|uniref:VWFA domain-containing protein n=1 Tax=Ficus carica TaxID=3494 RepID=A0AA88AW60_FICCA|nr:hypothetical protein TIFTF001_022699 [Ficus carica]